MKLKGFSVLNKIKCVTSRFFIGGNRAKLVAVGMIRSKANLSQDYLRGVTLG